MYFYREYGGKEVDLIVEDYKKNYTTIEIKTKKGAAKKIFPLPNTSEVITTQNYFEKITGILKNKQRDFIHTPAFGSEVFGIGGV